MSIVLQQGGARLGSVSPLQQGGASRLGSRLGSVSPVLQQGGARR